MATSRERPTWMLATDEAILEELCEHRLDYVSLVASRRGINIAYAERRFEILERHGLVEQTTAEMTYRITDQGERWLDGHRR